MADTRAARPASPAPVRAARSCCSTWPSGPYQSQAQRLAVRVGAAPATAAAALGCVAFTFTGGASGTQAAEPWACDRDGSVRHDY
ncbi:hypothetical protein WBG99_16790 [Streptomyces sp. TG1A-60]|uniref:hypothetical protein n=1 Tax=Streptomyces sp. TG1A-60 TaxID=3129111 RepID=UPI0030CF13E9